MTGDGTHTYEWDAEDRMVSVDGGSTVTQKYNALGQRVERFLPNGSWTFDYLFSPAGEELGLYSAGTAAWFDQNVPMGGRVLVMYGSPSRFLHANNLGTTTVTTDQTGAELQDELFYPWGQDWTRAGQPYVMHFAGMQGFENPGLVYPTDFRKYNPALGRWMTPDPLAGDVTNPQSLNRYAYVTNNPTTLTDPLGLYNPFECDPLDPIDCGPPSCYFGDPGDCPPCDPVFGCPPPPPGGAGGGGGTVSSAPPAGQPPLAGMGNAGFPNGSNVCSIVFIPGVGPQLSCTRTTFPSPGIIAAIGGAISGTLAYLYFHPVFVSVNYGVAAQVTYQASTRTLCGNGGLGASVPPTKWITFGVYNAGHMPNWTNVLSGSGYSFGANAILGYQASTNSSGTIGGPSISPGAGLSGSYTYGGCVALP